jgi:hypothetical protein
VCDGVPTDDNNIGIDGAAREVKGPGMGRFLLLLRFKVQKSDTRTRRNRSRERRERPIHGYRSWRVYSNGSILVPPLCAWKYSEAIVDSTGQHLWT